MCAKAGITLNPEKVKFGFTTETFFGLDLTNGKIEPSDKNLSPVKKMVPPQTDTELLHVMGVFDQFQPFIKDYSKRNSPATIIRSARTHKGPDGSLVPFHWDPAIHGKAMDELKRLCLNKVELHSPDPDRPLILESDVSDDGWGATLYQLVEGERRVIRMWSKQWPTSYLNKPPYHCEAKAWMNALELAKPFTIGNKHPIQCYTDHSPLTWIKHTSGKGPVSQFILDNLSEVDLPYCCFEYFAFGGCVPEGGYRPCDIKYLG